MQLGMSAQCQKRTLPAALNFTLVNPLRPSLVAGLSSVPRQSVIGDAPKTPQERTERLFQEKQDGVKAVSEYEANE